MDHVVPGGNHASRTSSVLMMRPQSLSDLATQCVLLDLSISLFRYLEAVNMCKQAPALISMLLQIAFYGMWFSATDTCSAYITEWLGLLPLQVVTCGAMV